MTSKDRANVDRPELSDAELVAGGSVGDSDGLAAIYERYADRLFDYALAILGDHADAEDAVHDGYVIASQRLTQLRDPHRLRPWLYAITRSTALALLRRRKRDLVSDPAAFVLSGEPSALDSPIGAMDARDLVAKAVVGLNQDDRELLNLQLRHDIEGAALAEIVGETVSNVNVASHRMRRRLEQSMTAIVLVNSPDYECSGLAAVVREEFSPLVRKRAARHIDDCKTCKTKKVEATSAAALFSSLPFVVAPGSLRERLDNVDEVNEPPEGGDPPESSNPSRPHRERGLKVTSERPSRPKSSARRLLVGASVVVLALALLGLAVRNTDSSAPFSGQRIFGDADGDPLGPESRRGGDPSGQESADDNSDPGGGPTGGPNPIGPGSTDPASTDPGSTDPDSTEGPDSSTPNATSPANTATTFGRLADRPSIESAGPLNCSPQIRATVKVTSEVPITNVQLVVTEVNGPGVSRFAMRRAGYGSTTWSGTAVGLNQDEYEVSVRATNSIGTRTLRVGGCSAIQ